MTARDWTTELSRRALLSRGPGISGNEARQLSNILRAAVDVADALEAVEDGFDDYWATTPEGKAIRVARADALAAFRAAEEGE